MVSTSMAVKVLQYGFIQTASAPPYQPHEQQGACQHSQQLFSQEQAAAQQLEVRLQRLGREESRLLDAYQAGVLALDELAQRRPLLEQRRRALVAQREQQGRLRQERARGQAVLTELTTFCERIRARLSEASFEDRQAILQLLIERLAVPQAAPEKLRPRRDGRNRVSPFREKPPERGVMPAELVSAAVAVLPDPRAQPLRLGHQLLARHRLQIVVHSFRLNPWPAPARSRPDAHGDARRAAG